MPEIRPARHMNLMDNEITIVSCTKLEEDGEEYDVVFDNGEHLSLSGEEVIEFGLYREGEKRESYDVLCTAVLSKRMMAYIASYVLFTSRTSAQVIKRIDDRLPEITANCPGLDAYAEDAKTKTLDKLKELGYVDDDIYARKYVSAALKGKPVSRSELMSKLVYTKGISKEIAEQALDEIYSENPDLNDEHSAVRLLKQKTKGNIPTDKKELAKLYRFMAGKGFSMSDTERALRFINEEEGDSDV